MVLMQIEQIISQLSGVESESPTHYPVSFSSRDYGIEDRTINSESGAYRLVFYPREVRDQLFLPNQEAFANCLEGFTQSELGIITPELELTNDDYLVYKVEGKVMAASKFNPHAKGIGPGIELKSLIARSELDSHQQELIRLKLGIQRDASLPMFTYLE